MVTYAPAPDAIVCNNLVIDPPNEFLEVFRLDTYYPSGGNNLTYHSYSGQDQQYDLSSGAWAAGDSDYDCASVNLNDLPVNGTTTPYAVNYGDTMIVTPNGLSTDPVVAVLLAAFLMLYTATYVRRVFFS